MSFDFFGKVVVHRATGQTLLTVPIVLSRKHKLCGGEVVKVTVERDEGGDCGDNIS